MLLMCNSPTQQSKCVTRFLQYFLQKYFLFGLATKISAIFVKFTKV